LAGLCLAFGLVTTSIAIALPALAAPQVQAKDWIIVDADSGNVLDGLNPHQRTAMASLTKMMTGLITVELGDLSLRVTVEPSDLVGESSAGLVAGETLTLKTLLYGLLLPSGNDAAMAIARAVGGSPNTDDAAARERFVGWMNQKAADLGLKDTHFMNPHGLDQNGHYTTVYDLTVITRAAIEFPAFLAAFGAQSYTAEGHSWTHLNRLPQMYPGVVGGKTGWTDNAGLCLIEVVQREGREVVMVLINSTEDRWYQDAIDLLDYGWTIPVPADTPANATADFYHWSSQTDFPISQGKVQRSWVWGPTDGAPHFEPYADAPGSRRIVQYFDKGRMEVNDPAASLDSGWYVTGGRLAWEMISGEQQIGDDQFADRSPAEVPVAGDPGNDGATYATLSPLLGASPGQAGAKVTSRLNVSGQISSDPATATYGVSYGAPIAATNHGVATVFADFLNQDGPMYLAGQFVDGALFNPPFAVTGYPITEPYWVTVPVGGVPRDVLIQCFERRCLTYTPANASGWQVEMGNNGQHYLSWLKSTTVLHPVFNSLNESRSLVAW
jgi:D-alanyl-D-alanine carboxypeptidase